ncbi:MAG: GTP cyclohydrolase I FolE [Ignavibacteriales bacterium]|nr:GTP cyclohydrolase I FolE [Ignavibacteriales bacterium]
MSNEKSNGRMEALIQDLLKELGESPGREGLLKTPARVSRMFQFFTKGYRQDVKQLINSAVFKEKYSEMVIVKDIDFFSLCEHHLIPFYGKCHIAYVPDGKILGLSKLPRIVEMFSRRLQVQERLTQQIADTLFECLKPQGVGVVMEARHLCMIMRGVEKLNSVATTSAMLGTFRTDVKTRSEFLTLIERHHDL